MIVRKQKGFTIIEFMIAGTLGLILLAGLMMMFISSQQTSRSTRAQLDVQNEGRFAMRFLTTQIQQTGWTAGNNYKLLSADRLLGLGEDSVSAASLGGFTLEASDQFSVQYEGITDCNGSAPTGAITIVTDAFQVVTTGATPTLVCNGEPIVGNVESFQVLYQIADDVATENRRWVNASGVVNQADVRAIRIELLLASQDNAADTAIERQFTLLDEVAVSRTDRKLRQIFRSTIELNNMLR